MKGSADCVRRARMNVTLRGVATAYEWSCRRLRIEHAGVTPLSAAGR